MAADSMQPFRDLLEARFPKWQIAEQVRKHVGALEALPPQTEEREAAIAEANEFLALLVDDHGGQLPD